MPRASIAQLASLASLAALAFAAVAIPGRARGGACARPDLHVYVATPATASIPRGEGFLVALGLTGPALGTSQMRDATGFEHVQPVLVQGASRIAVRLEPIAPGLARARPASALAAGGWTIEAGAARAALTAGASSPPPALAAPELRAAWLRGGPGSMADVGGRGGPPMSYAGVDLAHAPSADAVAAILYIAGATDVAAFGAVLRDRSESPTLYGWGGRCSTSLPGERIPGLGDSVRLAWVDAWGRVSPPSIAVPMSRR